MNKLKKNLKQAFDSLRGLIIDCLHIYKAAC